MIDLAATTLHITTSDPTALPSLPTASAWPTNEAPSGGVANEPPLGAQGSARSELDATMVEQLPAPARDNPRPVYPSALRDSGVEGRVVVSYVVDSAGRVDPARITIDSTSNAQFAATVRSALVRARFIAGRTGGWSVRVLVRQAFTFTITR